jgi:hypothetical protein
MTLRIAYKRPDGGVNIVIASTKDCIERDLGLKEPMTEAAYTAFIMERSIPPEATDVTILPENWVAPERSKRDKWRLRNGRVEIEE